MPDQPTAETIPAADDYTRPTYEDLTALGERIVAEFNEHLQRIGEPALSEFAMILLRHDIVSAAIDVRYKAADHAMTRAWNAVHRSVLR